MNRVYLIAAILASAFCTALLRALPFGLLGRGEHIPHKLKYLGRVLPSAIMAVLIIYCLKAVPSDLSGSGIRQLAAVLLCAVLQLWRRNTLLSILISTAFYMMIV